MQGVEQLDCRDLRVEEGAGEAGPPVGERLPESLRGEKGSMRRNWGYLCNMGITCTGGKREEGDNHLLQLRRKQAQSHLQAEESMESGYLEFQFNLGGQVQYRGAFKGQAQVFQVVARAAGSGAIERADAGADADTDTDGGTDTGAEA